MGGAGRVGCCTRWNWLHGCTQGVQKVAHGVCSVGGSVQDWVRSVQDWLMHTCRAAPLGPPCNRVNADLTLAGPPVPLRGARLLKVRLHPPRHAHTLPRLQAAQQLGGRLAASKQGGGAGEAWCGASASLEKLSAGPTAVRNVGCSTANQKWQDAGRAIWHARHLANPARTPPSRPSCTDDATAAQPARPCLPRLRPKVAPKISCTSVGRPLSGSRHSRRM